MKRTVLAISMTLILAATVAVQAETAKQDIDVKAVDGVILKATVYSAGQPGPGVLLLHQCNMDRKSWDGLAMRLASQGIHVLTLDYRGYGESAGAGAPRSERRAQRSKWESDVEAAYKTLISLRGVDKARLGAGGASCGVSNSVRLARHHKEIQTLVLLSGRTDDAGLEYLKTNSSLSVYGAASEEDTGSARSIRQMVETSSHAESKLAMYHNAGHGVPMFSAQPELPASIVAWYKARLMGD